MRFFNCKEEKIQLKNNRGQTASRTDSGAPRAAETAALTVFPVVTLLLASVEVAFPPGAKKAAKSPPNKRIFAQT